ncbi:ABC transporter permease subunit [Mesorhizobium sp. NBSH29]|uniref:amino acid ABC transporter permease n=1 Tax=Mesorhizobium sp. NBSH29 TaxID=2654249 RepID=UPI001896432C|nr:amino acid ABC transporter permease [Mesorhizobium sp. NBSH29]QPC85805.1 ABC transporter permease subunit [Mesorhizobium sp. NBSH29]
MDTFLTILWTARYALLGGLAMTVFISALAVLAGSVIGVFVGLVLSYARGPLNWLVRMYVDFVRGTPVLVLILASFYILGSLGWKLDAFQAGILALAVFCSSHVGEIIRGALSAIPRGQTEAAKAVGLTFGQSFTYVLLPQAARIALPAWVNTAVEIVKASTLLSIIGVAELLLSTQEVIARSQMGLPFYFLAGFIYFLVNFAIERVGKLAEKRLAMGVR